MDGIKATRAIRRLTAKQKQEVDALKQQIAMTNMFYEVLKDRVRLKCEHHAQAFLGYFCEHCGEFLG